MGDKKKASERVPACQVCGCPGGLVRVRVIEAEAILGRLRPHFDDTVLRVVKKMRGRAAG